MARVQPFRAFRYVSEDPDITRLTAPPYDVIGPALRTSLLERDRHNVVALELPEGALDPSLPGNRYETGARRWQQWRDEGVLAEDVEPAIYVLEQEWQRDRTSTRRRAFVAAVGLEPFDAGVILPHERTLPKALDDRLNLTRACAANLSQVLGLYADPRQDTAAVFDRETASDPLSSATDDDGITSRLWSITNPAAIAEISSFFEDRHIFIADGHHRYTTALTYRDERRLSAHESDELGIEPAYDFVMMALASIDDPDLVVLPTHRVVDADGPFDASEFWARMGDHFDVSELPAGHPSAALEQADQPSFLVKARGDAQPRLVSLRADVDLATAIDVEASSAWKHLDVAVLQELVLLPIFGIHPDRPATLDRLTFVKDARAALSMSDEHDVVFVLRPTRVDQLQAVALSGETMPQKSTYFYPKLLSGLLMRSLA